MFKIDRRGNWITNPPFLYLSIMKNKVKQVELTQQEWQDALRMPTPHKNKKKYSRKGKNKRNWISED